MKYGGVSAWLSVSVLLQVMCLHSTSHFCKGFSFASSQEPTVLHRFCQLFSPKQITGKCMNAWHALRWHIVAFVTCLNNVSGWKILSWCVCRSLRGSCHLCSSDNLHLYFVIPSTLCALHTLVFLYRTCVLALGGVWKVEAHRPNWSNDFRCVKVVARFYCFTEICHFPFAVCIMRWRLQGVCVWSSDVFRCCFAGLTVVLWALTPAFLIRFGLRRKHPRCCMLTPAVQQQKRGGWRGLVKLL